MGNMEELKLNKTVLAQSIEDTVAVQILQTNLALPKRDDEIVQKYIALIEGEYDLSKADTDIKHSIELLNIAYNCAPSMAAEGDIKVALDKIMSKLLHAQQTAVDTVSESRIEVISIIRLITADFMFWKPLPSKNDVKPVANYVEKRFIKLLEKIDEKTELVCKKLEAVAGYFRAVVSDAQDAVHFLEKEIGIEAKQNQEIQELLAETKELITSLEKSVKDIEEQIKKIDKQAEEFANDARTAEQRSFITGLVGAIAGALASVLPAAMAMASPAGAVSAAITSTAAKGDDSNQKLIDGEQKKIDSNNEKISKFDNDIDTLNEQLELKKSELEKLTSKPKDDKEDKSVEESAIAQLKQGIKSLERQIESKKAARERCEQAVAKLEAGLQGVRSDMNNMSEKQASQAKCLRELQQECLKRADIYFDKKMEENKELGRLKGVLESKKIAQNTLEISIRSMNLSVQALKQCVVIIESIAAFFTGFKIYLRNLQSETKDMLENSKSAFGVDDEGKITDISDVEDSMKDVIDDFCELISTFFIDQTAQWHAADVVCEKFGAVFKLGKTYAAECYGQYLHGEKLDVFLATAGNRIDAITKERSKLINASRQKILKLVEKEKQAA